MKHILITGGAGFIGSNLAIYLKNKGNKITIIDNLILGKKEFIEKYIDDNFVFFKEDLLNYERIKPLFVGVDTVFHLAANSDINAGRLDTNRDLQLGTIATRNVLEAMKVNDVKEIVFSSTSAIYGEKEGEIDEDTGPLFPISFYGASKLACEALISSFVHNYDMKAWIYRYGNIIGRNPTHGVVYDFINKLKKDKTQLEILGDGNQAKPYVHVDECIDGMVFGWENLRKENLYYFNLATNGATKVAYIAELVIKEIGLKNVELKYTGGKRGWKGDVPYVKLATEKYEKYGWKAKLSSDESMMKGVKEIVRQLW